MTWICLKCHCPIKDTEFSYSVERVKGWKTLSDGRIHVKCSDNQTTTSPVEQAMTKPITITSLDQRMRVVWREVNYKVVPYEKWGESTLEYEMLGRVVSCGTGFVLVEDETERCLYTIPSGMCQIWKR